MSTPKYIIVTHENGFAVTTDRAWRNYHRPLAVFKTSKEAERLLAKLRKSAARRVEFDAAREGGE